MDSERQAAFLRRIGQPGEAATRHYLAELGWVRPEDGDGPAERIGRAEAESPPALPLGPLPVGA
ncbi:hypothetical protein LNKW23_22850 [Paralimibaculum aggregatum]|uniref:Uncharacterized protein n=1 Tax=Paralimibaculum aggregatum TaxID=3036245 RepID=A0ABQ6LIG9_9RHOB|nr:hypothetical protein LNKW23_22850 [Limibaculum sp. NKW23]